MRSTGASYQMVADRLGVSKSAVSARARKEGWADGRDVNAEIRHQVARRVARIANGDPEKVHEAINTVAADAAAVVLRHRDELQRHVDLFPLDEIKADFEVGKSARISVQMLSERQKAERLAWGLDEQRHIDWENASDEDLERLASGKPI